MCEGNLSAVSLEHQRLHGVQEALVVRKQQVLLLGVVQQLLHVLHARLGLGSQHIPDQ